MFGELIPCGGGDVISLHKETLLIGRRSRCDVTLRFPNVSSHHCQLEFINGYWRVRDLGSSNGIKVNGERCTRKWLLPGDILHVAKHRFEVSYEPQSDEGPPEEENPFELSLLEKAGLEQSARPKLPKAASPVVSKPSDSKSEDEEVLGWLMDD